jgi:Domain of unknown function (DUF2804), C-terminal
MPPHGEVRPLAPPPGPVPPARMPLLRGTRPLKRWRYVAIFCEELMACASVVQVGPARQTFWAVLLRDGEQGSEPRLLERTRMLPRRGAVELGAGALRVHDRGARANRSLSGDRSRDPSASRRGPRAGARAGAVTLELTLEEDAGIEAACSHGEGYVWTRKQAGVAARGVIAIDGGAPRAIEALAVIDDTAGYHARTTEWRWAAGVGVDPSGTPLAFNLVQGVNDPPGGSERAVWVAGKPHEVPPVSFASDLTRITTPEDPQRASEDPERASAPAGRSELRFEAEAERSRRESLLIVRSEYRAPFGSFSGTLPGGIVLARGLGVVEHHRAQW